MYEELPKSRNILLISIKNISYVFFQAAGNIKIVFLKRQLNKEHIVHVYRKFETKQLYIIQTSRQLSAYPSSQSECYPVFYRLN
jgi:hypothetical protein